MENALAILEEREEYIKKVMNGEIESTAEVSWMNWSNNHID